MEKRVSVAMATYNGEKYLKQQIETILNNLGINDELIISDDGSVDNTIKIIENYMSKDSRVKLINGPHKGVKQNFANAIKATNGKYIFLADQDDVWEDNKIEKVLETFEKQNCTLVIHDAEIVDENLNLIEDSFFKYRNCGKGIVKNIWKNTYIGCCMAFDTKIKDKILPIPDNIEMHDQWIGIINERNGHSYFLDDKLIKYRRHGGNASQMHHHPIEKMIKNRINFIRNLM